MTDFFDKMQLKVKRKDKGLTFSRDLTVLLAHVSLHSFANGMNQPYLPFPSQTKLVLIYRTQLSWPG